MWVHVYCKVLEIGELVVPIFNLVLDEAPEGFSTDSIHDVKAVLSREPKDLSFTLGPVLVQIFRALKLFKQLLDR